MVLNSDFKSGSEVSLVFSILLAAVAKSFKDFLSQVAVASFYTAFWSFLKLGCLFTKVGIYLRTFATLAPRVHSRFEIMADLEIWYERLI